MLCPSLSLGPFFPSLLALLASRCRIPLSEIFLTSQLLKIVDIHLLLFGLLLTPNNRVVTIFMNNHALPDTRSATIPYQQYSIHQVTHCKYACGPLQVFVNDHLTRIIRVEQPSGTTNLPRHSSVEAHPTACRSPRLLLDEYTILQ